MYTINISTFLSNIKDRVAERNNKPTVEKNLYTILGFKGREDFENKTSEFVNQATWELITKSLMSEIDYFKKKDVIGTIIRQIVKNKAGKKLNELNNAKSEKKKNETKKKIAEVLSEVNTEETRKNLLELKEQAKDFLKSVKETQEKDQKKRAELKKKLTDNTQSTIETIENFRRSQEELLLPFGSVGPQLFVEILKYIESLEKLAEVIKDELVKNFLLNRIKSLNKKHPELQDEREDAIRVLSSGELREVYNKDVKEGLLQPMASYEECKSLYDKMNQMVWKENLKKIDKSIVSAINDIKKYREAILNCKNFQSSYVQEKKEHPFRGNACQKMIDIYQERIAGYQEKICKNLTQIRELFKSMPQKICSVKEFEELMDGMHKAKQFDEDFYSAALICLSNIQYKLDTQLKTMENPPTELRVPHTNAQTELTRL
ncbi:hypothetical protein [Wolbachia endosymbiont of Cantharis cryptica]|uniref:hypothetical protein n=1 Tax=Wolbachia endosymbiont of Cantharis cryptica TaxID=3066132 RepID=UPI00376EBE9F